MIAEMKVNPVQMRIAAGRGFSTATDIADYLVRKGSPSGMPTKWLARPSASVSKTARISPT